MSSISFIYGSKNYGLTTELSDIDYAYIADPHSVETLKNSLPEDTDVWTYTTYKQALVEHNLKAIEIYFTNVEFFNKQGIYFTLNKEQLRRSVSKVASNAYVKAKKKIAQNDVYIGLKSFWHSIRIIVKAIELAKYYTYNPLCSDNVFLSSTYADIMSQRNRTDVENIYSELHKKYKPIVNQLLTEFRILCPLNKEK